MSDMVDIVATAKEGDRRSMSDTVKIDDYIRIEWDKICRSETALTANGKPLKLVGHVKLEWPGGDDHRLPLLTIEQHVLPVDDRELPARVVAEGYLVPRDLWGDYQQWRKEQGL